MSTTWERWLLRIAFTVLAGGVALPILTPRYLPLVDFPAHAAQVALWRAWEANPEVQRAYTLHPWSPYSGFYVPWRFLVACDLSLERAGNLLVALSAVTIPLGFAALLKARGRPVFWALAMFPFVFNKFFAWGMLPFYAAFALLFPGLALFARWLRRSTLFVGCGAALVGLVLLWIHPLVAGFWGLACGLLVLFERTPWARRALSLWPLLPTGALLVLYAGGTRGHGALAPDFRGSPEEWARAFFASAYDGLTPEVTAAIDLALPLLAIATLGGVLTAVRSRPSGSTAFRAIWVAWDLPMLTLAAAAFLLYLFVPFGLFSTSFVNVRFASMALLFFIAALPEVRWRPGRIALLTALALVSIEVDLAVARSFRDFNRDIGQPSEVFAALPAGASIGWPLNAEHEIPPFELDIPGSFGIWAQTRTLGQCGGFTHYAQMLVQDATRQPEPLFSPRLMILPDGGVAIDTQGERLPEALVFYSKDPLPGALPVSGLLARYELAKRSGGLNGYVLERSTAE